MEENTMAPVNDASQSHSFKEAVCVEVERIFDSCSDKDCLEDLRVYFTHTDHAIIDRCSHIKCRSAEVLEVFINVEPVAFNRGFYAVDLTFYFRVNFSAQTSPISNPINVRGLCVHTKRVILFGSEGGVRTFFSGKRRTPFNERHTANLPTACVKTVAPVTLGSRICDSMPMYSESLGTVPVEIASAFEGDLVSLPEDCHKVVLVTLGVFTICTLERSVQLLIPAYDYSIPEKDCTTNMSNDDPCEMFKKIKFPVEEFFPENLNGACECNPL